VAGFIAGANLGLLGLKVMNDREGPANAGNRADIRLNGVSTDNDSTDQLKGNAMKITATGGMCLAIAIALGCAFISKPQRGKKIIEAWETTNSTFKVSVTAYAEENGSFVPGAYYDFRSAPSRSERWQEIFTFRHDDLVPIPNSRFIL
jgi:hypothetical protein